MCSFLVLFSLKVAEGRAHCTGSQGKPPVPGPPPPPPCSGPRPPAPGLRLSTLPRPFISDSHVCVRIRRIKQTEVMFTPCWIAFTPARKQYRIYKASLSHITMVISMLRLSLKWRVTYWIGVHTIPNSFSCWREKISSIL